MLARNLNADWSICRGQGTPLLIKKYLPAFLFLMSLTSAISPQEPCQHILLSGAEFHRSGNTLYTLDPNVHCNGRPVYVDRVRKHYIYYLLDGYDGWMVSPTSCYHWGNFMIKVKSNSPEPYTAEQSWSEFNPERAEWIASPGVTLTCSLNGFDEWPTDEEHKNNAGECSVVLCVENSHCVVRDSIAYCECNDGFTRSRNQCVLKSDWVYKTVITLVSAALLGLFVSAVIVVIIRRYLHRGQSSRLSASPEKATFKYKPLEESNIFI